MTRQIATLLAMSTFCLSSMPAIAASEAVTFDSLDGNADGFVSQDEIPADHSLAKNFTMFDADGDGKLNRAEFDAASSQDTSSEEY